MFSSNFHFCSKRFQLIAAFNMASLSTRKAKPWNSFIVIFWNLARHSTGFPQTGAHLAEVPFERSNQAVSHISLKWDALRGLHRTHLGNELKLRHAASGIRHLALLHLGVGAETSHKFRLCKVECFYESWRINQPISFKRGGNCSFVTQA